MKTKKVTVEIPKYEDRLQFLWEDGFSIKTEQSDGQFILEANSVGLISLATHLISLAQDEVPSGSHFHLDDLNSLDSGSVEIVIGKIAD